MSEALSYFKANYGRRAGSEAITRFYKIDSKGKISYVEKREHRDKDKTICWNIGNIKFLNFTQSAVFASSEKEYSDNLKKALEDIQ